VSAGIITKHKNNSVYFYFGAFLMGTKKAPPRMVMPGALSFFDLVSALRRAAGLCPDLFH
jgi:hypothetical protein